MPQTGRPAPVPALRIAPALRAALIAGSLALAAAPASAQGVLAPGDAIATQFSGFRTTASGDPRPDPQGVVLRGIGLAQPGFAPDGSVWERPSLYFTLTAADIGQVFGIAFDREEPANAYVGASSAYGLYRGNGDDGWADGMWGPDGGPGTIWKLAGDNGYRPEILTDVGEGDGNGGAGLGDLAFDPWHGQLLVSDLESGLIHRIDPQTGETLGTFDHGVDGRSQFLDAERGEARELDAVAHDPDAAPRFEDCGVPDGGGGEIAAEFVTAPECWNYADFRRRVWGLGVDRDPATGDVRVYYAVWGGAPLGGEDWVEAGEDARTSLWSVALDETGGFDAGTVRRELVLPTLEPDSVPDLAYDTAPVTDIAVAEDGTMVLAERGRPAPSFSENGARLIERGTARLLVLVQDDAGDWQIEGRIEAGAPESGETLRGNASGAVAFGPGYADGAADPDALHETVWATVDPLCTPEHPCRDRESGEMETETAFGGLLGADADDRALLMPADDLDESAPDDAYVVALAEDGEVSGAMGAVAIYGADPPVRMIARARATDAGDDGAADEEEAAGETVATGPLPRGTGPAALDTDLATSVEAPEECDLDSDCTFEVTVTNDGDEAHEGPLTLTFNPGATSASFAAADADDWTCFATDGRVFCRTGQAMLEPGNETTLAISLGLAETHRAPELRACASLVWLGQQGRERIRTVQARLKEEGHEPGVADGAMGPNTEQAIRAGQAAMNLPETGRIDGALVEALFGEGANLRGDDRPTNDQGCATVSVDVPQAARQAPAPAPSAPAPSGPAPEPWRQEPPGQWQGQRHDPDISRFHRRYDSSRHDPRSSGPARGHDRRYSYPPQAHDQVMSRFHQRFNSAAHDPETSGPMRLHNVRDSMRHEQYGSRAHDRRSSAPRARHDGYTSRWIFGSLERDGRPAATGRAAERVRLAQLRDTYEEQRRKQDEASERRDTQSERLRRDQTEAQTATSRERAAERQRAIQSRRIQNQLDFGNQNRQQRRDRDYLIEQNRARQSDGLQERLRREGSRLGIGTSPNDIRRRVR